MKMKFTAAACSLLIIVAAGVPLQAQLAAPTAAGVSLGATIRPMLPLGNNLTSAEDWRTFAKQYAAECAANTL